MNLLSNKVNVQQLHLTAVDLTQGQRGAAAAEKHVCSHCQHCCYFEPSGCINGKQRSTDTWAAAIMLLIQ